MEKKAAYKQGKFCYNQKLYADLAASIICQLLFRMRVFCYSWVLRFLSNEPNLVEVFPFQHMTYSILLKSYCKNFTPVYVVATMLDIEPR